MDTDTTHTAAEIAEELGYDEGEYSIVSAESILDSNNITSTHDIECFITLTGDSNRDGYELARDTWESDTGRARIQIAEPADMATQIARIQSNEG